MAASRLEQGSKARTLSAKMQKAPNGAFLINQQLLADEHHQSGNAGDGTNNQVQHRLIRVSSSKSLGHLFHRCVSRVEAEI